MGRPGRQAADGEGVDGAVAGQQECLIRLAGRGGGQYAYAVDQRAAVGVDNHRRLREFVAELVALSLAIAEADPRWKR
jgi:hypothetical protein